MKKAILNPEYELYERDSKVFASSRQVAETFGKEHKNVLRDIAQITASDSGLSEEFNGLNFELVKYKDSKGERRPEYLMTRDGFTMLVMGYRGKKAMRFKEMYIRRFNEMESFLKELAVSRMEFPAFTDAVMMAHDAPKHYHYSNELNMIYRIIFGVDAKQLRLERGAITGRSIRPYLSEYEIKAIESLQRADIGMLAVMPEYTQRKAALEKYYNSIRNLKRLSA